IWRCWMVWGRCWKIILFPTLCLAASTGMIICLSFSFLHGNGAEAERNEVLFASFMLTVTLWCTLLIIYRIWSVTRRSIQVESKKRAYRYIIEVVVESSALYSISLIVYIASYASTNNGMAYYFDIITAITKVSVCHFQVDIY
ncbi:hypothetical protein ARMSODRAFT_876040, partial [Armillaria solidipes]